MTKISYKVVVKLLSDLDADKKFDAHNKSVFKIKDVVISIPKDEDMDVIHLVGILENQLEMSWWMIDYVLGQNGIS